MLEAIFSETILTVTLSGLTQWDYGQKLYIKGLDLPEVAQIHFSNNKRKEAIVMVATKQGDYTVVDIPNVLLEEFYDITAWVYIIGENSGETIRAIYLKVDSRIKPQNFISQNPTAEDLLAEVIDKINKNIKDNTDFKEELTNDNDIFKKTLTEDNETFKSNLTKNNEDFKTQATHDLTTFKNRIEEDNGTFKSNLTEEQDVFKEETQNTLNNYYQELKTVSDKTDELNDLLGTTQNKVLFGTTPPTNDIGVDGDIYIQIEGN